ncbi:MAG: DUF2975 domain-containing protein, partial [Clostridiaceae bacterium]|nr:DUF2975 domain-containing protein [Clostridiaceae bacterium]
FILMVIVLPLGIIGLAIDYSTGVRDCYEMTAIGLSLSFIPQSNNGFIADYNIKWIAYSIPGMIIFIYIIYHLMKLFKNFSQNIIFEIQNFKRTRVIGISIILLGLFGNVANYISALTINNFTTNGVTFHTNLTFVIIDSKYAVGLIIVIIGEIFKRAIELKKDQDLTI